MTFKKDVEITKWSYNYEKLLASAQAFSLLTHLSNRIDLKYGTSSIPEEKRGGAEKGREEEEEEGEKTKRKRERERGEKNETKGIP